jgi:UDP-glucose 4-epimerase
MALGQKSPFAIFSVGTGIGTAICELITLMQKVTGRRACVVTEPSRPVDVPVNILDSARARQYLN